MATRILRVRDACARTGLSKSTLYELISAGHFPRPIKLSTRSVGFIEEDVECWLQDRIRRSRGGVEAAAA